MLRLVKTPNDVLGYAVIGIETEDGKTYYAFSKVFTSPGEALRYRGAAKDLHGYQAYQTYVALEISGDGQAREVHYAELDSFNRASTAFLDRHPGATSAVKQALVALTS